MCQFGNGGTQNGFDARSGGPALTSCPSAFAHPVKQSDFPNHQVASLKRMAYLRQIMETKSPSMRRLWIKRLDHVKTELRSTRWPRSAEAGMRLVLELSNRGRQHLLASLKADHPRFSTHQIETKAYQLMQRWDQAKASLAARRTRQKGHGASGLE
jgi:hypothetical protein